MCLEMLGDVHCRPLETQIPREALNIHLLVTKVLQQGRTEKKESEHT